ncbi:MAG: phosphoribosylamine--glycine ligase [Lactobacillaceae bacterium]|nr:phosphoribosylamine--glycine ligase [Lactobacillaceae bacterium]
MAKVLVIGSGAREHAIAQTFLRSPKVEQVIVTPGNAGMTDAGLVCENIAATDIPALVKFAQQNHIALTMVGSEDPLTHGVVDTFRAADLKIFGPTAFAAQLEGSKAFAKKILIENEIPTADSEVANSLPEARAVTANFGLPVVIKLDGLALGKGVTIVKTQADLEALLTTTYANNSKQKLVVEEFLAGVEFSIFSFVGENGIVHAPIAQDHKRLLDRDEGPNTGGMGAYSPVRWIDDAVRQQAIDTLVLPAINGIKAAGATFTGILYTGVMLTAQGPKVIEFNVRLGDPEAQMVLPQLESDFYQMILDLVDGKQPTTQWQTSDVYMGVVLAAPGYPVAPEKGLPVPIIDAPDVHVNYAGVKQNATGALITSGGRVVTVISHAKTAHEVAKKLYDVIDSLHTDLQYRHDIAYQALNKEGE